MGGGGGGEGEGSKVSDLLFQQPAEVYLHVVPTEDGFYVHSAQINLSFSLKDALTFTRHL